jgi:hypothetical protein
MKVYVVLSDGRENHETIVGVYADAGQAYARLGAYIREHNDKERLTFNGYRPYINDWSDEKMGRDYDDAWSVLGAVQECDVIKE